MTHSCPVPTAPARQRPADLATTRRPRPSSGGRGLPLRYLQGICQPSGGGGSPARRAAGSPVIGASGSLLRTPAAMAIAWSRPGHTRGGLPNVSAGIEGDSLAQRERVQAGEIGLHQRPAPGMGLARAEPGHGGAQPGNTAHRAGRGGQGDKVRIGEGCRDVGIPVELVHASTVERAQFGSHRTIPWTCVPPQSNRDPVILYAKCACLYIDLHRGDHEAILFN